MASRKLQVGVLKGEKLQFTRTIRKSAFCGHFVIGNERIAGGAAVTVPPGVFTAWKTDASCETCLVGIVTVPTSYS